MAEKGKRGTLGGAWYYAPKLKRVAASRVAELGLNRKLPDDPENLNPQENNLEQYLQKQG